MFQTLTALGGLALAAALLLPQPLTSAPATEGAYQVDPVQSSVLFGIEHFGASNFYGRFNEVSGEISYDPAAPKKSTVKVEVPVASIDTNNNKRDEHLRGPDFFAAKEFPTMSFESKSIERVAEATELSPLTLTVKGELEIAGKRKPLTVDVMLVGTGKGMGGGELIGFETHFTIKRSDFGVDYMLGGLGDEVDVIFSVEAGR